MAEQELRHYRHGGKLTHIGMEALPSGRDIVVIIDRIAWVENEMVNGEKKPCWVAYFKKNPYFDLPMILNATNKKRLARLAETPYLETVKDLAITLTKEMDKAIGGGRDLALRVSVIKPKVTVEGKPSKPKLLPNTQAWTSAVEYLQGGNPITNIEKKYEISPEDMILLKEALEVVPEKEEQLATEEPKNETNE